MSFFSFPFFVQFLVFLSRVRISYSGPEHDPHYHLNIHTSCGEHGRPLITTSSSLPLLLLLPLSLFLLPPQPATSSDFPFPCQPASQGRAGAVQCLPSSGQCRDRWLGSCLFTEIHGFPRAALWCRRVSLRFTRRGTTRAQ